MVAEALISLLNTVGQEVSSPQSSWQNAVGAENFADLPNHERAARKGGETHKQKRDRLYVEEALRDQRERELHADKDNDQQSTFLTKILEDPNRIEVKRDREMSEKIHHDLPQEDISYRDKIRQERDQIELKSGPERFINTASAEQQVQKGN